MRVGKSSGPVQRIWVESSRTSPSPSASVDLAHLRPRPRFRFVHSRHTSSEPEAEGDSLGPRQTLRADADVIVTLNHLFGIVRSLGRRQLSGIQGTPPFNRAKVGDGAAFGVRYGVVPWSSRPPGHRLSPLKSSMIHPIPSHPILVRSVVSSGFTPPPSPSGPAAARRPSAGRSSCRRGASRTSRTAAGAPLPRSPSCHPLAS
jgi:hypothetical protein